MEQFVSLLAYTTQMSKAGDTGQIPDHFAARFILEFTFADRKRHNTETAVCITLLVYGQRQTMTGAQAGLAVFGEIAGEVRCTFGYVERLIGMPRHSLKY